MALTEFNPEQQSQRLARLNNFGIQLAIQSPEHQHSVNKHALLVLGAVQTNEAFDLLDAWLRYPVQQKLILNSELEKTVHSTAQSIMTASQYVVKHATGLIPGNHLDHHHILDSDDPNTSTYRLFSVYKARERDLIAGTMNVYDRQRLHLARISIFGYLLYQKEFGEKPIVQ